VIKRFVLKLLAGLVITMALAYLGDWTVWRVKLKRGGGTGKIKVSRIFVAPLKGHKEAYYIDGTAMEDCSRSMFPQAGMGACWWMERHRIVFER
jgi:hypothetical protein